MSKFSKSKLVFLAILLPSISYAANMTNNIDGVGPIDDPVKPYICVQNQKGEATLQLAPGKSGDANKASGNNYYVGATLRIDGCDKEKNAYLGYIGFLLSSSGELTPLITMNHRKECM